MTNIILTPPSTGAITQYYGNGSERGVHSGNDYAYSSGGKIHDRAVAMDDGVVVWADDTRKLGWPNRFYFNPDFDRSDNVDHSAGIAVVLEHWYGMTTYCHLYHTPLNIGDRVKRGQYVGTVGETGFSYGKHLHAELILNNPDFSTVTGGRADLNKYMVASAPAAKPTTTNPVGEWDEMASKAEIEAVVRSVVRAELATFKPGIEGKNHHGEHYNAHMANVRKEMNNPAWLDKVALTILKRPINLVDPSAKSGKITGTTTLAMKGNWEAYNFQDVKNLLGAIADKLNLALATPKAVTENMIESVPETK